MTESDIPLQVALLWKHATSRGFNMPPYQVWSDMVVIDLISAGWTLPTKRYRNNCPIPRLLLCICGFPVRWPWWPKHNNFSLNTTLSCENEIRKDFNLEFINPTLISIDWVYTAPFHGVLSCSWIWCCGKWNLPTQSSVNILPFLVFYKMSLCLGKCYCAWLTYNHLNGWPDSYTMNLK